MPALHELQRAFAAAMATGESGSIAAFLEDGPIAPADRLRIHRNTMLGALTNALRLTYPAVEALVGPAFFEQAARQFVRQAMPSAALLTDYGTGFPGFLDGYAPAGTLPYLGDVARLELAVEQAARGPDEHEAPPPATIALAGVTLALVPSLILLAVEFPADAIWRAVLEGDDDALGRVELRPAPSRLAVWRDGDGAAVAALSPMSAAFLDRLLRGADAATALAGATGSEPDADAVATIATEIVQAGFVRLTPATRTVEETA